MASRHAETEGRSGAADAEGGMNRAGCFVAGVVVGFVLMEIGHALYFRNPDYLTAAIATVVFGCIATACAEGVGTSWG